MAREMPMAREITTAMAMERDPPDEDLTQTGPSLLTLTLARIAFMPTFLAGTTTARAHGVKKGVPKLGQTVQIKRRDVRTDRERVLVHGASQLRGREGFRKGNTNALMTAGFTSHTAVH